MNGVRFEKQDGMMVSVQDVDDIPEKLVEIFLSVDGFALLAGKDEVELTEEEKAALEEGAPEPEKAAAPKPKAKQATTRKTAKGA